MTVHTARADAEAGARSMLSLDGIWQFRLEGRGDWREAAVPMPWQAQFPDLRETSGTATYRKTFSLPKSFGGREVAVCFGAVNYFAEIFLNGERLGEHEGGYLPFEFVLPSHLLHAENTLEVRATLPSADYRKYPEYPFSEIPHGKQSWYGPLGGIWQSVRLEARDKRNIGHVSIRPDLNSGAVSLDVDVSEAAIGASLAITILDGSGVAVASLETSAGSARLSVDIRLENIAAWSPDAPNLYSARLALKSDGSIVDARSETFGFRTIETRDGALYLNGEPLYMRGALDQDYYPEGICTPPSLEFLEDQARKAKALGLNLLRCHIKVPDPRYYEVADRFGLLVWTEIPNIAFFTKRGAERLRETMQGILHRDGNHPSIIAWTIINEDWGTRLVENAEHREWVKQTFDWLKAEDPTLLVVDNSGCFANFHVKSDLNDYHYYRSVPERKQEWDDITAQFASGADWTYTTLGDAERRGDEPLIVSEFGVWGLPDPKQVTNADGSEPNWFETGPTWGEGAAYPHGVQMRFDVLHLDTVFGTFDSFIEQVQWYQFRNLKYEIETMRAHASIQGYVITELTDVHWEANGLMDLNRNPRVFGEVFSQINADLIIIPRLERHAGYAGDTLPLELSIATGGQSIPDGARLNWSGPLSGGMDVPATGALSVAALGTVELELPQVSENGMLRLDFTLEANGEVLARNHVEIAVYAPRRVTSSLPTLACKDPMLAEFAVGLGYEVTSFEEADIVVAHALDAADIEAMNQGARYVVLADGTAKTYRNLRTDIPEGEMPFHEMKVDNDNLLVGIDQPLPNIGLSTRDRTMWRGDWIASFSWIRREGAFASLPGGPMLDLSFDRVVPHYVMTGFRPWEFEGLVHAGLVVGWVHKPAVTIAERLVGRGGLVATTFRLTRDLPGEDPVAAALWDGLIVTATRMQLG